MEPLTSSTTAGTAAAAAGRVPWEPKKRGVTPTGGWPKASGTVTLAPPKAKDGDEKAAKPPKGLDEELLPKALEDPKIGREPVVLSMEGNPVEVEAMGVVGGLPAGLAKLNELPDPNTELGDWLVLVVSNPNAGALPVAMLLNVRPAGWPPTFGIAENGLAASVAGAVSTLVFLTAWARGVTGSTGWAASC
jgi:hypothetical protein